jgi:predicted GNAT superfamily acetyltransferase
MSGQLPQIQGRTAGETVKGCDGVVLIQDLATPERLAEVLPLNNASAVETSLLDGSGLSMLLDLSWHTIGIENGGRIEAFMIALDHRSAYDNPNFAWFKVRYSTFVYVDRVVTAVHARGRGHGRRLYADLFEAARGAGHIRIVCEVNRSPPNPGSDTFHHALGFVEVGEAALPSGKVVRYLEATLAAQPG